MRSILFLPKTILMQSIQIQLSKTQKTFSQFFSAFSKSRLYFEHFQTKMTLTVYVFPELRTPKDMVREMCRKSHQQCNQVNGPGHC